MKFEPCLPESQKIEKLEKNERKNVFADEKTLLPALFALKPGACTVKNYTRNYYCSLL